MQHLEDAERHALEHDVLSNHAREEVTAATFSSSVSANLTRFGLANCHDVFELGLLHAQVVEPLGEDLDVPSFVERLRCEEAFAGLVGCATDQTRRGRQGAALAGDQLHGERDRLLAHEGIREQQLRLGLTGLVPVFGPLQVALWTRLKPTLNRIPIEEVRHD